MKTEAQIRNLLDQLNASIEEGYLYGYNMPASWTTRLETLNWVLSDPEPKEQTDD